MSSSPPIVYTAIFGGFDALKPPKHPAKGVRYVCLTDSKSLPVPKPWTRRVVRMQHAPRLQARRCKILSHEYFPDYDVTVWHGGNVVLVKPLEDYLAFLDQSDIAALPHPQRRCAYQEAQVNIHDRRASKSAIRRQMRSYEQDGFPHDYGLHAAFLLVRRHSAKIKTLNEFWWTQVKSHTARDQLSFDYSMWKLDITPADIPVNRPSHDAGPYHRRLKHRRRG
jgi:hypothetical protein